MKNFILILSIMFSMFASVYSQDLPYATKEAHADFDRDGDQDLLLYNANTYKLSLYLNNGNGTFIKSKIKLPEFLIIDGMSWGDFDGDGYDDLIINGYTKLSQDTTLLYHNDSGKGLHVVNNTNLPNELDAFFNHNFFWIDYDGDGDKDLFLTWNTNFMYINNGDSTFTKPDYDTIFSPVPSNFSNIKSLDYNKDGLNDLLLGTYSYSKYYLYKNNGDGTFSLVKTFNTNTANIIAIADIDQDSYPNIIDTWGPDTNTKVISFEYNPSTGDFDTDTLLSIGKVQVDSITKKISHYRYSPVAIDTADLDKDGKVELLIELIGYNVGFYCVKTYKYIADSLYFQQEIENPKLPGIFEIADFFDINGDSYPDALFFGKSIISNDYDNVTEYSENYFYDLPLALEYINNKQGKLIRHKSSSLDTSMFVKYDDLDVGDYRTQIAVGDYNNDGYPDILSIYTPNNYSDDNYRHQKLLFYLNTGYKNFTKQLTNINALHIATDSADFDGNGLDDILFTTYYNNLIIGYNQGNLSFKLDTLISGDTMHIDNLLIADFNADAKPDFFVFGESKEDLVNILFINNDTNFTAYVNVLPPAESWSWWDQAVSLNLNNDKYPDILTNGHFFINNGNNTFTERHYSGFDKNLVIQYAYPIDYNHDGYDDIIVDPDGYEGLVQNKVFYINQQGTGFKQDTITLPDSVYEVDPIFTDMNHDGYKDIILYISTQKGDNKIELKYLQTQNSGLKLISQRNGNFSFYSFATADFDKNNTEDYAFTGYKVNNSTLSNNIYKENIFVTFMNDSTEEFCTDYKLPSGNSIKIADFDNDSHYDLLVKDEILKYPNSEPYSNIASEKDSLQYYDIYDFNNDGLLDVFSTYTSNNKIKAVFKENIGNGNFVKIISSIEPHIFTNSDWSDFNRDGIPDILIPGMTNIYHYSASGFNTSDVKLPESFKAVWIDYNHDHLPDIALIDYDRNIDIYIQKPNNTFTKKYTYKINSEFIMDIQTSDVNNDGWDDLIFTTISRWNYENFYLKALINGPNGFSQVKTLYNIDGAMVAQYSDNSNLNLLYDKFISQGDFNNDGKIDFLISNITKNLDTTAYLLLNYYPDSLDLIKIPTPYGGTIFGDIDGDKDLDIITTGYHGSSEGISQDKAKLASHIYLNKTTKKNQPPTTPTNMHFRVSGDTAFLYWSPATDAETPSPALTYNVYLVDNKGNYVMNCPADHKTGFLKLPRPGNVGHDTSTFITGLKKGVIYHWAVQAVDNFYQGGQFSQEQTFTLAPEIVVNPANQKACEQSDIIFSSLANMYDSLKWQADTGTGQFFDLHKDQHFSNVNTQNLAVKNITTSMDGWQFRLEAMNMGGDEYSSTATLTVVPLIKANAGQDTIICSDSLTLFANSPQSATGTWSCPVSGITFDNANNPVSVVHNIPEGSTILTWTINQGGVCGSNSDALVITRQLPVDKPTAPDGDKLCVSGLKQYSVPKLYNAEEYQWALTPDTAGSLAWTDNQASITWNNTFSDTAYVKVRAGNHCGYSQWSDSIQIINYPVPQPPDKPSGLDKVCAGSQIYNYNTNTNPLVQNYEWYLYPTDAGSITQNQNSATVQWNSSFSGQATIKVRAIACQNGDWSEPISVTVFSAPPDKPQQPIGDTTLCMNTTSASYTVPQVDNASTYIWTISNSAGSVSSDNNIATVTWAKDFAGATQLQVTASNVCGQSQTSDPLNITILPPPPDPAQAPSGDHYICNGSVVSFSAQDVNQATSYQWKLSPDSAGSITNSGTNALINFSQDFSGNVSLAYRALNQCGSSNWSPSMNINVDSAPQVPQIPTGQTDLCSGSALLSNYSTNKSNLVNYYQWEISPADAGSISGNGYTISISWNTNFSGQALLRVKAIGCKQTDWSQPLNINIYSAPPDRPATPIGLTDLCINANNTFYNIQPVDNAVNYQWHISKGADSVYQNLTSAQIDWNNAFSGTSYLRVRAKNACGFGDWSDSLRITVKTAPLTPQIPSGMTTLCTGSEASFATSPVKYASSYLWQIIPDTAANIIGNNSTVNMGLSSSFEGTAFLKVKASNNCGESNWSDSLPITVTQPHPSPIKQKGKSMLISPDSGYVYQWFLNHSPIQGETKQYYYRQTLLPGMYQVQLTDNNGCSAFSPGLTIGKKSKEITLYPNPAYTKSFTKLRLCSEYKGKITVKLITVDGKVVKIWKLNKTNKQQTFSLEIPVLANSLYIMEIITDSQYFKFIKILNK